MHSWFDILQSKGVAIEFTSREKDHILNRAQIKYVNEVLQKKYLPSLKQTEREELIYSISESNVSGQEAIEPLLAQAQLSANSTSVLSFSAIQTEIAARLVGTNIKPAGYTSTPIMMVLGVVIAPVTGMNYIPCRYVSKIERHKNSFNVYRKSTPGQPSYCIEEKRVQVHPKNSLNNRACVVYAIREPDPVHMANDSANRVNCELPDFTHDEIMAIALDDAGVATRDQTLMQLNQANKDNLTESA